MAASRMLYSARPVDAGSSSSRVEPGTEEWARRWRSAFLSMATGALLHPDRVRELMEGGLRERPWQSLSDPQGQSFASFEAFCASPRPYGLGLPGTAFYGYAWRGLARRVWIG